jgi:hypothetical protein
VAARRNRNEQARYRRRWPFLAALLVALMLGHDALMAVGSVAAAPLADGVSDHVAMPLSMAESSMGSHGSTPTPMHPEQCYAAAQAAPNIGNPLDACAQAVPHGLLATDLSAESLRSIDGWGEPLWPPGKRRALLQVYRI